MANYMEIETKSNKKTINKIYFAQKGSAPNKIDMIRNLINYCFHGNQNFISIPIKLQILKYLTEFRATKGVKF
jgi:hypothetical protein